MLRGRLPPRYRVDESSQEQLTGPLTEYERLAARVTTTGEIRRAGLWGLEQAAAIGD